MLKIGSLALRRRVGLPLFSKVLIPLALAFGWHGVDATLNLTRSPRRARIVWVGVGVGWSAFWLIKYFTEPPVIAETKLYSHGIDPVYFKFPDWVYRR